MISFRKNRPNIAVTGPNYGGHPAWIFTAIQVWFAGGNPFYFSPNKPLTNFDKIDGVILGGGADISEKLYQLNCKEESHPTFFQNSESPHFFYRCLSFLLLKLFNYESSRNKTDFERDLHEMKVIRLAINKGIPILGICRGMQLLNIYFGGSLESNISSHFTADYPHNRGILPVKKIKLHSNSHLFDAVKKEEIKINSFHDQGIKTLGSGMKITSQEPNGVIQSIECESSANTIVGVQWHPEFLIFKKTQRNLFKWFIHSASNNYVFIQKGEMIANP